MRGDYDILCEVGSVVWASSVVGAGWRRGLGPTGWLPTPSMLRAVRSSDLLFQWFASPAAPVVAARLCGKPALVVAGGYDVAAVPEIGYGLMLEPRSRWMGMLTLSLASRVLCLSRFAQAEVLRWAPRARAAIAYLGLSADLYPAGDSPRAQVVTIGAVCKDYLERKGLTTFARTSRLLPDVTFVLMGKHLEPSAVSALRELGGSNLVLPGYLPEADLKRVLRESAVYAQLSLHEGFGYALAEAMLCGCTPVVTGCGALPEVTAGCGLTVPPGDPQATAQAVASALAAGRRPEARQRIVTGFSLAARRERLRAEVGRLVKGGPGSWISPRTSDA